MNAAVGLMDGLGLDGDRCISVIPRQKGQFLDKSSVKNCTSLIPILGPIPLNDFKPLDR